MRLHLSSQGTRRAVLQAAILHRDTCNRNNILYYRSPVAQIGRFSRQRQPPRSCSSCLIPARSLALPSPSSSSVLAQTRRQSYLGYSDYNSLKRNSIHPLQSANQHTRNLTVFSYQSVDMEVTRHNFRETLPIVGEALGECQFYAFDCEMTGLFVSDRNGLAEGKPPAYLHDMEDRYEEILQSSESFVINQFGLSTFSWNGSSYQAKTFNFYTFPKPFEEYQPRFLCEASSLDFLSQHKFDFNKWIHEGIPYMPGSLRDKKLKMVESPQRRNEIVPMAEEDKMLVADLRMMVRKWLHQEDSAELLLAPVNAYQRALQYQELRKDQFGYSDPPGFYTDKVEGENGRAMIKLIRASSEEVAQREKDLLEQRRNAIIEASGFSEVLDLMRISGKPAVGHNYSFDVAYSLHSFVSPLPSSWEEYRKLVQWQFPGGIFDTKLIAKKLFENCQTQIDTSLGMLYNLLTVGDFLSDESRQVAEAASVSPRQDLVLHARGFDKYAQITPGELAHEAGYDAFMTGTVFACLVAHASDIAESSSSEEEDGQLSMRFDVIESLAWKMHLTRSDMEYAAFSGEEDIPQRQHIIYVRNIPEHLRVRRGNELSRDLSKKGLPGVRVTVLENGLKALIEFPDAETASNVGLPILTEMYQDADVQEYSAFREDVKAKRDLIINKRKDKSRFRPRPLDTDTNSSKKQKGEHGQSPDQGIKCSIM